MSSDQEQQAAAADIAAALAAHAVPDRPDAGLWKCPCGKSAATRRSLRGHVNGKRRQAVKDWEELTTDPAAVAQQAAAEEQPTRPPAVPGQHYWHTRARCYGTCVGSPWTDLRGAVWVPFWSPGWPVTMVPADWLT